MSTRNPSSADPTAADMRVPARTISHSQRCGGDSQPPRARSAELLGAHGELIIEHAGQEYRLRCTRSGKLILTK